MPEANLRAGELARSLAACEARPVSVAPIPPATSSMRPIVTLALGVVGSFAVATAALADGPSDTVRVGLGVGGAAALAGGVLVAIWP